VVVKPLLLLDVDGVLNPFAVRPGIVPSGFVEHTILGYRVLLARRHGDWLTSLADRFELVWATTWEEDANELISPLVGLPMNLPVIAFPAPQAPGTWKLPAVAAFVADRPAAWIDDDLGSDAQEWASLRPAPTLLLRADPSLGLVRRHIDALERFARRLSSASESLPGGRRG
jgi:hypothetical protein